MGYIKRGVHLEVLFSSSGLKFSLTNFLPVLFIFQRIRTIVTWAVSCQLSDRRLR